MSQVALNAIEKARLKRERKLAERWANLKKDPIEWAKIEKRRAEAEQSFANGIPLESIPLLSPEPFSITQP